jgi:hypothetical protein
MRRTFSGLLPTKGEKRSWARAASPLQAAAAVTSDKNERRVGIRFLRRRLRFRLGAGIAHEFTERRCVNRAHR